MTGPRVERKLKTYRTEADVRADESRMWRAGWREEARQERPWQPLGPAIESFRGPDPVDMSMDEVISDLRFRTIRYHSFSPHGNAGRSILGCIGLPFWGIAAGLNRLLRRVFGKTRIDVLWERPAR
jgi:hypothetical protein